MPITKQTLAINQQLRVAVGQEADAATRSLTAAWVRAWDEIASTFREACLAAATSAVGGRWPLPWELQRIEAVGRALTLAGQALSTLGARTGVEVSTAAGVAVKVTAEYEPRLIASQLPAGERVAATERFAQRILPQALDVIVARTQGQIESTARRLAPEAAENMRRELVRGVAVGTNPRETARRMVARTQGAFEGGLTRATVLARSEVLDAYRTTSQYAHSANADVVAGWRWLSARDSRVCPSCLALNGREFPVSVSGPADHQQGRCSRTPVVRPWRDLGIDLDEPPSTFPDARQWFDDQPEAAQVEILGPSRYELLKANKVTWDDFATLRTPVGWRPNYAPTSVRDLQRKAAA